MSRDHINEIAYRAYCAAVEARGHRPEEWAALGSRRRRSWRAAVRAVLQFTGSPDAELGEHRDTITGAPMPRVFVKHDESLTTPPPPISTDTKGKDQ